MQIILISLETQISLFLDHQGDMSNVFHKLNCVLYVCVRACVVLGKTEFKLRGLFKDPLDSFCYSVRTFTRLACLFTNGKPTRIKTSKLALCYVELCKDP